MESFFEYDQNVYDVITKNKELVRKKEMIDKILKSPQIKKLLQKASNGKFDLDEDNKNFSKMVVDSNYDINTILDKYMKDMYNLAPEQRNIGATEPRSTAPDPTYLSDLPLPLGRTPPPLPTYFPPPPTNLPSPSTDLPPPSTDLPDPPPFTFPNQEKKIELPGVGPYKPIGPNEDKVDRIPQLDEMVG